MKSAASLPDLALLPFASQCADIAARIDRDDKIAELLTTLGQFRDHEPLAFALTLLCRRGLLGRADITAALDELWVTLADTAIQRALRTLEPARDSHDRDRLAASVARAMSRLPLRRLAVVCLMDRWLKNNAPATRDALVVAQAEAEVRSAALGEPGAPGHPDGPHHDHGDLGRLDGDLGRLDTLADEVLLRVPGDRLAAIANACSNAGRARFAARMDAFAARVLDVLEAAPKSLSQANAEEILARRVYTDPGHFLVELLQNAEDAGAARWRVDIAADAVTVWHDGAPFDAKDVVGVLSIGQTTKRKDQIGFFGVGFKSVYEVCVRPQVYSGPFCFEIAEVSIPRRIVRPPAHDRGTLMILGLRDPDDPERHPEALFARALAVPPQTLLTLSSLREMAVRLGERGRLVRVEPGSGQGRLCIAITEEPGGSERRIEYLCASDHVVYEGTGREASRATRTPVLVAVMLDNAGRVPLPLPEGAPTVFSYLPTRERSGLKFLIHAHFDLPVDRERLDLDSPWNRWAIAAAGTLLVRLASELANTAEDQTADGRCDGLLDVMPLPDELAHPTYRLICDELRRGAGRLPLLPGAHGERLCANEAALMPADRLGSALAGVDLDGRGRRALAPMPARRAAVAELLGAVTFGPADLVALVLRTVGECREGDVPLASWFERGYETVLGALASAPRDLCMPLAELPCMLDQSGRLRRPRSVAFASPALRRLYGDCRVLASERIAPGSELAALMRALGAVELGPKDLIADLALPDIAAAIAGSRSHELFAYLARLPQEMLAGARVGELAIFRVALPAGAREAGEVDEAAGATGSRAQPRLCPLVGEGAAWLVHHQHLGLSPLGELCLSLDSVRASLVDPALSVVFGDFFRNLGGRTLDVSAFVRAALSGAIVLGADDLGRFHRAVDAMHADLAPRVFAELRSAALFPDRQGRLRPLTGPERALVPRDPQDRAIIELAPAAPWLRPEIAALAYVRALGIALVGPAEIAEELIAPVLPVLFDLDDPSVLRRIYAYLIGHHTGVSGDTLADLAAAPVWLSTRGERLPLAALRLPAQIPELAAVYQAWHRWQGIAYIDGAEPGNVGSGATALALARALRLDSAITAPSFATLIDDLARAAGGEPASEPPWLAELRQALIPALRIAASEVPRSYLAKLADAALFAAAPSTRDVAQPNYVYPLRSWRTPLDQPGVARARPPLAAALALGSRPLLAAEDEDALAPLLAALGTLPATAADLIAALRRDPALADREAKSRGRAALVALRHELLPSDGPALEALALWPTTTGELVPAARAVRRRDLARLFRASLLGEDAGSASDPVRALTDILDTRDTGESAGSIELLAAEAERDADALSHLLAFADPAATAMAMVERHARAGEPLAAQPPFLRNPETVAELFCIAAGHRDPFSLPLVVNANGHLVAGKHLATDPADPHILALCQHLPLYDSLARPLWASAVARRAPARIESLTLRQVVAAMAQAAPEPRTIGASPWLASEDQRRSLYQWLATHREAIAADPQMRGALARACVIASKAGWLRAPAELLLDPTLPDLGIDWNAAAEVPEVLTAWLRRTYAPDDTKLAPLVEHLLEAYEGALRDRKTSRAAEILGYLARSLRIGESDNLGPDHAAALVKRFKLRKRLRVEDTRGELTRPRALLAPSPERWQLITAFAAEPPGRVSPSYDDPATRALIQLAGAATDLSVEAMRRYLGLLDGAASGAPTPPDRRASGQEHLLPGLPARLALARYIAELAAELPALHGELALDRVAWIPAASGVVRPAHALYWPGGDEKLLLGDQPEHFPHPAFYHTTPAAVAQALPFRRAKDAALADVVAHVDALLAANSPVPEAIFVWLEDGLHSRRLSPGEVREVLAPRRFLRDHRGRMRIADELVREGAEELFGERRGDLALSVQCPRLLSALKIPKQPSKREIALYLGELGGDIDARGASVVLAEEPGLLDTLPRCIAHLIAAGGAPPERLPLIAETTSLVPVLCVAPTARGASPGLFRRHPPELVAAALQSGAAVLLPAALAGDDGELDALLASMGVPDLAATPPEILPEAASFRTRASRAELANARRSRAEEPGRADTGHALDAARSPRSAPLHGDQDEGGKQRSLFSRLRKWLADESESAKPPQHEHEQKHDRGRDHKDQRDPELSDSDDGDTSLPPPQAPPARPGRPSRTPKRGDRRSPAQPPGRSPGTGRDSDAPAGLPDHSQWFRQRRGVGPQLGDNRSWAEDRAHMPSYGLAFSPRSLPWPYLYSAQVILDRFEPGSQRWVSTELSGSFAAPVAPGHYRVNVRGRIPAGEVVVPVPAYGRVEALESESGASLVVSRDRTHLVIAERDTEIEYTVCLDSAPDFAAALPEAADSVPPGLLVPTVPDSELPAPVLNAVERMAAQHSHALDRALAVRSFIRDNYYYDRRYIEDAEFGTWLAGISRGRGNAHIAAMHAGRDAKYLGRGVCYELNNLACELLRRVGIPAAVAVGWTFDRGFIDEPDHMWAVALLPTEHGSRWLPIDASTTRDGSPLHAGRRPPGPWRAKAPAQHTRPPKPPDFARDTVRRHEDSPTVPIAELVRVVRYLQALTGESPASAEEVRRQVRELLTSPEAARALLDRLR